MPSPESGLPSLPVSSASLVRMLASTAFHTVCSFSELTAATGGTDTQMLTKLPSAPILGLLSQGGQMGPRDLETPLLRSSLPPHLFP